MFVPAGESEQKTSAGAGEPKILLSSVGADCISARIIERTFLETLRQYNGVESPIFVVMPNHFHPDLEPDRPAEERL